jgi:hypothetical protein
MASKVNASGPAEEFTSPLPMTSDDKDLMTDSYVASVIKSGVTLVDVSRAKILRDFGDPADRTRNAEVYATLWSTYKESHQTAGSQIVNFSLGDHAPWGTALYSDGRVACEFLHDLAGLANAKWIQLESECRSAIGEAKTMLRGNYRDVVIRQIYAQLQTLFSVVDQVAAMPESANAIKNLQETVAHVEEKVDFTYEELRRYALQLDRRHAQQYYLLGMFPGLIIVALAILLILHVPFRDVNKSFIEITLGAGSLGALLSVLGRTTRAQFSKTIVVDAEAGRILILCAGAFRPIVGAILGLAILVVIEAGLLPIKTPTSPGQFLFFFAAASFLGGFSERLAQDALVRTSRGILGHGHGLESDS